MDQRKRPSLIAHPAHLWVGQRIEQHAIEALKELLCPCTTSNCLTCSALTEHKHCQLLWFKPEKMYTLADIEPLFERIKFNLDENTHYFFVLEKADYLSVAVANRLLKLIEEPPHGYHILFLAQRLEQVLITIRSRCFISLFNQKQNALVDHALIRFFTNFPLPAPVIFLQTLEKAEINEQETFEYIDHLLTYWQEAPAISKQKQHMVPLLMAALEKPPMSGSSKLFWKNLYLQILYEKI